MLPKGTLVSPSYGPTSRQSWNRRAPHSNQPQTPSDTSTGLYRLVMVEAMDTKFYGRASKQLTSTITAPARDQPHSAAEEPKAVAEFRGLERCGELECWRPGLQMRLRRREQPSMPALHEHLATLHAQGAEPSGQKRAPPRLSKA